MAEGDIEWFDQPGGEPVELHAWSASWGQLAERWAKSIKLALAGVDPRIEHVGSTAVPGLVAKPVVDLLVSVPDVEDESTYRSGLESLGLNLRARELGHRFFRPPSTAPRAVHVHVCSAGSEWERDHVMFRDQLRARPDLASAYASLKEDLAARLGFDRSAYTEGKSEFIQRVIAQAPS